ncbi:class I SAM-dependent methyltransferase [Fodinibius sp. Rm-B-1B1-1]|uniref:class I SAM-dependent methyltransferase n=1 Tax=Fodinibius alkaliphilus TaxID=3140241 RepID=UPI00315B1CC8
MKSDQISKTAAFLAIKFYGLTRIPAFRNLFDDSVITFYDRMVAHLPAPLCYYHYWLKFSWIRKLYLWSEELLLPGDLLHVIARKWYIRQQIASHKKEGYEQIIVLGAGFDDLSYSFAQKGWDCFEIDVPKMADYKRDFLNRCYSTNKIPDVLGCYLTNSNPHLPFKESAIDPHKKTIIVAEGFFDYVTTDLTKQILSQINQYFEPAPLLITTHFALDELPAHHRWTFEIGVKSVGEQLQLHKSIDAFRNLLSEHDFNIEKQYDRASVSSELQLHTGTSLSVLKGFYVLVARQLQQVT